jgi:C-terminal processing protease CtpA/Prc
MFRHVLIAAALLGLFLAGSTLRADSPDRRRTEGAGRGDAQDQQTRQHLRAYLGVGVTPAVQGSSAPEEGVAIQQVSPNSPAARAGLRAGDIITQVGRRPVEDFRDLSNAITRLHSGDQVTIHVLRHGQERTLRATLAADQEGRMQESEDEDRDALTQRPSNRNQQGRPAQEMADSSGQGQVLQRLLQRFESLENRFQQIEQQARRQSQQRQYGRLQEESGSESRALQRVQQRVEELEERLQQAQEQNQSQRQLQDTQLGIHAERRGQQGQGVRVTYLDEDAPAAEAGLRRGDVILRVDGRRVSSVQDLRQALQQAEPGQELNLEVLRGGRRLDLDLQAALRASGSQVRAYQRLQHRIEQLERRIREREED